MTKTEEIRAAVVRECLTHVRANNQDELRTSLQAGIVLLSIAADTDGKPIPDSAELCRSLLVETIALAGHGTGRRDQLPS